MNNSNSKSTMDTLVIPTTIARLALQLAICLALLLTTLNNHLFAQHNGSFVNIQPVPGLEHSSAWEYISDISDDGLTIAMSSTRGGGLNGGNWDLYQSTRESVLDPFDKPVRLRSLNRSGIEDGYQTLSSDGLTSYFVSNSPAGSSSLAGIWTATRETLDSDWSKPQFVDTGDANVSAGARLSNDDLTLYFNSFDTVFRYDLFKMERSSPSEPFGEPEPVSELNTSNMAEFMPAFSNDELAVFYSRATHQVGNMTTMIATRPTKDEPFGEPVELDDFGLGSELNSAFANSWIPVISADWPADGSKLYFAGNSRLHGDWTIYEATWNVYADGDANLDDEVNFADFLVLSENFGQDGAWREGDFDGDGTVGFPDFLALAENFGRSVPSAAAAVPEPTGMLMAAFGILGLIGFRRRP